MCTRGGIVPESVMSHGDKMWLVWCLLAQGSPEQQGWLTNTLVFIRKFPAFSSVCKNSLVRVAAFLPSKGKSHWD